MELSISVLVGEGVALERAAVWFSGGMASKGVRVIGWGGGGCFRRSLRSPSRRRPSQIHIHCLNVRCRPSFPLLRPQRPACPPS